MSHIVPGKEKAIFILTHKKLQLPIANYMLSVKITSKKEIVICMQHEMSKLEMLNILCNDHTTPLTEKQLSIVMLELTTIELIYNPECY